MTQKRQPSKMVVAFYVCLAFILSPLVMVVAYATSAGTGYLYTQLAGGGVSNRWYLFGIGALTLVMICLLLHWNWKNPWFYLAAIWFFSPTIVHYGVGSIKNFGYHQVDFVDHYRFWLPLLGLLFYLGLTTLNRVLGDFGAVIMPDLPKRRRLY